MGKLEEVHKKIKFECIKAIIFGISLNAILIFLGLYFILSFLGLHYSISLVAAITFFVKSAYSQLRDFNLVDFKKKNPNLKNVLDVPSRRGKKNISETFLKKAVQRTKNSLLLNLIKTSRTREKLYLMVVLALLIILVGSFNLYPTKVYLSVGDIDLTKQSMWGELLERINIEKPEFPSCFEELEYVKGQLGNVTKEFGIVNDELEEIRESLSGNKLELKTNKENLAQCLDDFRDAAPYQSLYDDVNEKNELCQEDLKDLKEEKSAWLDERNIYIQDISNLRNSLAACG